MRPWIIYVSLILMFLYQCVPAEEPSDLSENTNVNYTFVDSLVRVITSRQVDGDVTSLYPFLHASDPTYRYSALKVFASSGAEKDSLVPLLYDEVEPVRSMAAYALGQLGEQNQQTDLIASFRQYDSLSSNNYFNSQIVEAIGKCGDQSYLDPLSTVSTYRKEDTLLLLGQVRGIYRYRLRDLSSPEATKTLLKYALNDEYPASVRELSANYFSRYGDDLQDQDIQDIIQVLKGETNTTVRANLVLSLGGRPQALSELVDLLETGNEPTVQINTIRAISRFPIEESWGPTVDVLDHENQHVQFIAAQHIFDQGGPKGADAIRNLTRVKQYTPLVAAKLLAAANKNFGYNYKITRANISGQLKKLYADATNPLHKGLILRDLATDIYLQDFIVNEVRQASHPFVVSRGLQALIQILQDPKFVLVYSATRRSQVAQQIVDVFYEQIGAGNGTALEIFADNKEVNYIKDRIDQAKLAQMVAAYQSKPEQLDGLKALTELAGLPAIEVDRPYSPIDWSTVSTNAVVIESTQGNIEIELLGLAAPQTVSRFISLAQKGYYDDIYFHRVVPNFVIQAGCPNGDGYGSTDQYLRTEVPPLYYDQPGMVGMASAGKDTESSQFFITHQLTPHLDGKYTIFGKVKKGMDVVSSIQVGDQILSMTIQ